MQYPSIECSNTRLGEYKKLIKPKAPPPEMAVSLDQIKRERKVFAMTKKAEAIYKKYCDKLELALYMYSVNTQTFTELQNDFSKLEKQFKEMLSGMYHYNLISTKDFDELYTLAFDTQTKYMNALLGIAQP